NLREELSSIDESWAAARFDSLPQVVQILTSKDREIELEALKEQSEVIEDVVNEVVQAYHGGFNKAIQNYSQILRLFSESAQNVATLKSDLAEAKKCLAARNQQLHQLWYRSVTLRHIISLLDQIEGISKIPARIEKLIVQKQYYAATQLHVHSALMLEREGLQTVGALQDVKSELSKLRSVLFYKVLDDLHNHLYNKGEYSATSASILEMDDEVPTTSAAISMNDLQPLSRRTRLDRLHKPSTIAGSSSDGHGEEGDNDEASPNGYSSRGNGNDNALKENNMQSRQTPPWLSSADPDEFLEVVTKSDHALHVKYLQTMVECLCKLGKRLRPTIQEIITSKIKAQAELINSAKHGNSLDAHSSLTLQYVKGQLDIHHVNRQKRQNGVSLSGTLLAVSPVTPVMAPTGSVQAAARELLCSILDTVTKIFENHVLIGEYLESKVNLSVDSNSQKSLVVDSAWNIESEGSQATGGYSIGNGSEDGLTFAFRFTDTAIAVSNQGWSKKSSITSKDGYGTATVLPEQGIYLVAAVYQPVLQFTDQIASMLPQKFSQFGNDGLLTFVENFVKDHFLPTMFVDYRKSPAAFRPRAHASSCYTPYVDKGRPILQGLLAIDLLTKEVLGWAQAMPKYAAELVKYVQTFLERAYERCRTSYMEAVLEKQSYMLIGRHDVESLMRRDPSSSCLPNSIIQSNMNSNASDAESIEIETQMSDLLLSLHPIKQENLIRDDNKLILLASLSDSLEYVADSVQRVAETFSAACKQIDEEGRTQKNTGCKETSEKDLVSFANDYRKLAIDCLKVLRMEMQLETVFHMQEMTSTEYMDDQDAEEPDDFIISLTAQITRRDEGIAPFVAGTKQTYVFGGICSVAANTTIKALAEMKEINLIGVQQICRNSIALEQALAALPSIDSESVQLSLDRVRTYYELLNMPFEALVAFITEHKHLFTFKEYSSLLDVQVPGRDIPPDAQIRLSTVVVIPALVHIQIGEQSEMSLYRW
ncbi:hypothetical protein V2J09_021291, partial [Rumex salicifolius]